MLDDQDYLPKVIKREVLVDNVWVHYDSIGEDTQKSREFYQKCGEVPFIQGSFSTRLNGVIQVNPSPANTIFYRKK